MLKTIFVAAAVFALAGPAFAQTNARAPDWARPILANDAEAMRLNRPNLAAPEGGVAVRLTIAPAQGGVARLIRYDSSPPAAGLGVRAFTGHLRNGWMLWGGENPLARPVAAAKKAELDRLARAALSASLISGEGSQSSAAVCTEGDYAWLEVADGARSVTFERRCATGGAARLNHQVGGVETRAGEAGVDGVHAMPAGLHEFGQGFGLHAPILRTFRRPLSGPYFRGWYLPSISTVRRQASRSSSWR